MTVDGADVFLETLAQAAERDRLRVKTRRNAHVFAACWFLTYPVGVGDLARWIRTRRDGPQNDLVRDEIVQAPGRPALRRSG